VFFFAINWKDIESKVVTPPYLPEIESELDLRNIDKMFTKEKPQETLEDSHLLQKRKFDDFTYVEKTSLN